MIRRNLCRETIDRLKDERLFTEKLKPDIETGTVFPAIRAGRVDFYYKGGKLFSYDKGFSTHKKYASVIRSDKDYISESDLQQNAKVITNFSEGYEQIKENCSLYSGVEAEGVSRIYHKYPFVNIELDIVVLDIEISFKSKSGGRSQDRIDILLLNKMTQKIRFYEAKHYSNSELWSQEGTSPRVISQIKRYEEQIEQEGTDILSQYHNYVTLLVFGYDRDQQKGRMQKLLLEDESLSGIQHYFIGNISAVKINNMWNTAKCC
jgi:hypothetical protein